MNHPSTGVRSQVIAAVVEGASINAACCMTGVSKHTVLKLLKDAGGTCAAYHNRAVRNLRVYRLQCDEIRAFVYGKDKNLSMEQVQAGAGGVWTWTALDADTKLSVSCMLGDLGASTAQSFMRDVAGRIADRIQLTTDGRRVYAEAVEIHSARRLFMPCWSRFAAHRVRTRNRARAPQPASAAVPEFSRVILILTTSPRHSWNAGMRRFTRPRTHSARNWRITGTWWRFTSWHYNFCRVHKTLRVTPAIEAGLTDHLWTLEELIGLI
jgi:hypothetical protein